MGYLIYTHEQITPATIIRPRLEGGEAEVENPARPILPLGEIVYVPPSYNRFSAAAADRTLLIRCDNGFATPAEISAAFPLILDDKYNRLWQAAHDMESRYISGVGLSILSLGVAQNKPKALAVALWSQDLWEEYYRRKALVSFDTAPDCDFSKVPAMPYSVPELAEEIGL